MRAYYQTIASFVLLIALFSGSMLYANSLNEADFCDGSTFCLLELVEEKRTAHVCSKAVDSSQCYYQSALLLDSPSLCSKSENQEGCYFDYSITKQDPSQCSLSSNSSYCFYSYALLFEDTSLCEFTEDLQSLCLKKLIKD